MENVADLMAPRLMPELLSAAHAVGQAAESAGVQPFLVGGSVRDVLADCGATAGSEASFDLDIALCGAGFETFDRIAGVTAGRISRRSQFVTAKLQLGDLQIDLAMARAEEYPTPGSLPVVRPGTLHEDLARRDFSINAMAVSLGSDSWGDLVDLHDGVADLQERRLRILHEKSFRDDPTRILRAARYSSRLQLVPAVETLDSLLASVRFIDLVSPARVRNELVRVFLETDPSGAMELLSHWGVLQAIHPCLGFQADAWGRFATEANWLPTHARTSLGYAILSCGISESDAKGLITRLNPGASERRSIEEAVKLGRIPTPELVGSSNSGLARVLDPLSEPAVLGVALVRGGELGCRISYYLRYHRKLRPHLTGDDLIRMGVPKGPAVGEFLKRLRESWLDDEISSTSEELALAESLIRGLSES